MSNNIGILLSKFFLATAMAVGTSSELSAQQNGQGRAAPAQNINAQQPKLKMLRFSAPWCPPCQRMKTDYEDYMKAHPEVGKWDFNFDIFKQGGYGEYFKSLGMHRPLVAGIPTVLLVDENGNILTQSSGFMTAEQIDKKFSPIIQEKRAQQAQQRSPSIERQPSQPKASTINLKEITRKELPEGPEKPVSLVLFFSENGSASQAVRKEIAKLESLENANPNVKIYELDRDKAVAREDRPNTSKVAKTIAKITPTMVVIDKKRKIMSIHHGFATAEEIKYWMEAHRKGVAIEETDPEATKALFDDPTKSSTVIFYEPGSLRYMRHQGFISTLPDGNNLGQNNFVYVSKDDLKSGHYDGSKIKELYDWLKEEKRDTTKILTVKPDGGLSSIFNDPKALKEFHKSLRITPAPATPQLMQPGF